MNEDALRLYFDELLEPWAHQEQTRKRHWQEMVHRYSSPSRHYHNLRHLAHLYAELLPLQHQLHDPEAVGWALFYHDIVYAPLRSDNEARSADLAEQQLTSLGLPPETLARIRTHILATQTHTSDGDGDTAYFLDADLSVLGASPEAYQAYAQGVRKEYWMIPQVVYQKERKKILLRFLERERLFLTDYFWDRYQARARLNLSNEIAQLT
ncbi:MAG: hypothetical protein ACFCUI_13495 [Bernardetiaceae bacterium]